MIESLTMRGTPYFMAPEVFQEKYGMKADIWSVGCVAFQMSTGSPPWKDLGITNPVALFTYIQNHEGPPSLDIGSFRKSPSTKTQKGEWSFFKSLLRKCFVRDPSCRPDAAELLRDPFFTMMDSIAEDIHSVRIGSLFPEAQMPPTQSPHVTSREFGFSSPGLVRSTSVGRLSSLLSPPLPRPLLTRDAQFSPTLDPSDWPSWARDRHHNGPKELGTPLSKPQVRKGGPGEVEFNVLDLVRGNDSARLVRDESMASSVLLGMQYLDETPI
jgi:serine/threonine protein kinase